jgi:NADH-quinone oxidoreductase subunit J
VDVALAGFILVAALAVLGALGVVLNRSPLYSALSLVGVFAATAVLYFKLNAPFLGVLQIIVYAGAIMVLFIFVIMLLSLRHEESGETGGIPSGFKRLVAVILAALLVGQIVLLISGMTLTGAEGPGAAGNVEAVGLHLYKEFAFPFEVASILLLVAIVGAVAITRRHGRGLEGHVTEEDQQ